MAIEVRGNVAVIKNGDSVMIMIDGDLAMAREIREAIADRFRLLPSSLSEEMWHQIEDLHAALNRSLGEVPQRPTRRKRSTDELLPVVLMRDKPFMKSAIKPVCEVPDCGCSGYAHP